MKLQYRNPSLLAGLLLSYIAIVSLCSPWLLLLVEVVGVACSSACGSSFSIFIFSPERKLKKLACPFQCSYTGTGVLHALFTFIDY